jgi:L-threonylcarbamoyladenylate synthase
MNFQEDIKNCIKALEEGGSILYPTDTVWGLGCDATNQTAVEKLLTIKQRSAFQGLIILVESENDILSYSQQTDIGIFDYLKAAVKPTTVIYEKGRKVASSVLNADGTIAMRVAKDDFCIQLLRAFGKPIVSTSANIHGEPTPSFFREVSETLKNKVDYIVQHRRNDVEPKESSALVRWLGNGTLEIIRP